MNLDSAVLLWVIVVVLAVLALAGPFIVAFAVKKGAKVPANWQWIVDELAIGAVQAAHQAFSENSAKLNFATDVVNAGLEHYGFKLSPVVVRSAIEFAYSRYKEELKSIDADYASQEAQVNQALADAEGAVVPVAAG